MGPQTRQVLLRRTPEIEGLLPGIHFHLFVKKIASLGTHISMRLQRTLDMSLLIASIETRNKDRLF